MNKGNNGIANHITFWVSMKAVMFNCAVNMRQIITIVVKTSS